MTTAVLASAGTIATAPAVLAVLVATTILLCLKSWAGTRGLTFSRRVVFLLNGATAVLLVVFVVLVIVRFKTVA